MSSENCDKKPYKNSSKEVLVFFLLLQDTVSSYVTTSRENISGHALSCRVLLASMVVTLDTKH